MTFPMFLTPLPSCALKPLVPASLPPAPPRSPLTPHGCHWAAASLHHLTCQQHSAPQPLSPWCSSLHAGRSTVSRVPSGPGPEVPSAVQSGPSSVLDAVLSQLPLHPLTVSRLSASPRRATGLLAQSSGGHPQRPQAQQPPWTLHPSPTCGLQLPATRAVQLLRPKTLGLPRPLFTSHSKCPEYFFH